MDGSSAGNRYRCGGFSVCRVRRFASRAVRCLYRRGGLAVDANPVRIILVLSNVYDLLPEALFPVYLSSLYFICQKDLA